MFIQEVLEVHKNHLKLKRAKYDTKNRETIEIIDMVLVIKGSDKQMAWHCLQTNTLYTTEALALACSSIASTATSTWSDSIESIESIEEKML